MKSVKYLLIGGGLAACEAVKGIRKHDAEGTIMLVGQEAHMPYNRPPLSKGFLQGKKSKNDCLCEPAAFYQENKVELLLGRRVTELDSDARKAVFDNGEGVQFEKALLATGGEAVRLPVNGIDFDDVYRLRTLDDSTAIAAAAKSSQKAAVIGGGFIGMEITASLASMGLEVAIIEHHNTLWPRFADPALAEQLRKYYENKGVTVLAGEKVTEVRGPGKAEKVITESGREVPCDFVVCAVGIKLNTELAEQADLQIDNGVVVDSRLQTSHPAVYAAGDIANYPDPYFNKRRRVEHWGQAEYTGGLAGENMAGAKADYDLLTYAWSEGFDLHYEFAGEENVYDDVIMRGDFPDNNFAALYLRDNRLRGFVAVNPEQEALSALEALVSSQADLAGKSEVLADIGCDISKLAGG
ncbi:MAG: FAD-dependent oxidoreductase [Lentisphaeria bacterium]